MALHFKTHFHKAFRLIQRLGLLTLTSHLNLTLTFYNLTQFPLDKKKPYMSIPNKFSIYSMTILQFTMTTFYIHLYDNLYNCDQNLYVPF